MSYKFRKEHRDPMIADIQRQISDTFAVKDDVDSKYTKVKEVKKSAPKANELKDGDTQLYDDGSNVYRYYKAGGRLFRQTLTEV
jgi:hypothetical protein